MTLGELKIACMKLIETQQEEISVANLDDDTKYNVIESINRALTRISELGKYPRKSFTINSTSYVEGAIYTRHTVSLLASDLMTIDKIVYELNGSIHQDITYRWDDEDTLVLPAISEGQYRIRYNPYPIQFEYDTANETPIALPINAVVKIPYFVKAEFYEKSDSAMAVHARNLFESYISNIPSKEDTQPSQDCIYTVLDFTK